VPKLTDQQARLFTEPNVAVVATLRPDGSPQASVVWIDYDGRDLIFTTKPDRAKGRFLERDPRVSITVFDLADPYRYVEVEGAAVLEEAGAADHIHEMSRKYRGTDYDDASGRVLVRVRPEHIHAYGV
jgi:PPOX class probable F420-dependent enzyme